MNKLRSAMTNPTGKNRFDEGKNGNAANEAKMNNDLKIDWKLIYGLRNIKLPFKI